MSSKEEFIELFKANITREGADKLLDYLENRSDFFTAPPPPGTTGPMRAACASTV